MRTENAVTKVRFKNNRGKRVSPSSGEASIFEGYLGKSFIRGVIQSLNLGLRTVKIGNEIYPFSPEECDSIWEILPIVEPKFGLVDSNILTSSHFEWAQKELKSGREVQFSAQQPSNEDVIYDILIDVGRTMAIS